MESVYKEIKELELTSQEINKLFVHFTKNPIEKSEAELVLNNFCKTNDDKYNYLKSFLETLSLPDGMINFFCYF